jgi:hypothetical protein
MAVMLTGAKPPLQAVAKLGAKASQIYGILWESALMDVRMDPRKHLPWEERRDCGGTTSWSKKGLADLVGSDRRTITKALDALLDAGFITVIGRSHSSQGSHHLVYRVIHPDDLEAQRHVISLFDEPPSVRWKRCAEYSNKDTIHQWSDEPSDYVDDWSGLDVGLSSEPVPDIYTCV